MEIIFVLLVVLLLGVGAYGFRHIFLDWLLDALDDEDYHDEHEDNPVG